MKKIGWFLLLFCSAAFAQTKPSLSIVPQPVSVKTGSGQFTLTKTTVIAAGDAQDRKTADYLNDYLQAVYGFTLPVGKAEAGNAIRLSTRKFIKAPVKETYDVSVTKDGISIEGDSYAATFYGVQTLLQLLPTTPNAKPQSPNFSIPVVAINDYPRFGYRGMHLDVSRHFFPASFVKKYIDYLALHKLNYFHWHLTEDQGWRIEIKKYPKLMSDAAYRAGTIIGRYPGTGNDNQRYGGYYTQEEVKDIVKYAAERYITVVPEIEMPGHSSAAIAAYPWLSCFPEEETKIPTNPSKISLATKGKKVQETWGVFPDIYCAGKDSTFTFLQDVLDEVLPLFPSTYIHVGGDEAPKANWKRCPRCQARIKGEGLKDEHGLQSYFIQRMEKYLNAKGKTLIGWDEILEGGLAPNAVVMSWRGEKGGIEAAKQKHGVIMTPEKPVYFNFSQTKNEDSLTIGGYNSLEAVYGYEPVPKELSSEEAAYVLGAQANMWSEYLGNTAITEYQLFPRLSALSEVLWSPKEARNWKDFEQRLQTQFKRYDLWKANYSKAYFDIKASITPTLEFNGVNLTLESKQVCEYCYIETTRISILQTEKVINDTITVHDINDLLNVKDIKVVRRKKNAGETDTTYFSDGSNNVSIFINNTSVIKAWQRMHHYRGNSLMQPFFFNKATGKKVSITTTPQPKYPGQGGAFSLVNGVYSNKGLSYPDWLGWIGDDLEATIDLGKKESIDSVRMHTLAQNGSWIYLPQYVEVFASNDGATFNSIGKSSDFRNDTLTMGWITVSINKQSARYIKLLAKNYGLIPDDQPGGGNKAWLFADEVQVY